MGFERIREWIYAKQVDRRFPKRRKRLVWRIPEPTTEYWLGSGHTTMSMAIPTVSKRKIRWLGRREVYPHSLHVHLTPLHRIEEP